MSSNVPSGEQTQNRHPEPLFSVKTTGGKNNFLRMRGFSGRTLKCVDEVRCKWRDFQSSVGPERRKELLPENAVRAMVVGEGVSGA